MFYARLETDECACEPCVHGSCMDQVNGFICTCDEAYSGHTCDVGKLSSENPFETHLVFFAFLELTVCVATLK